MANNKVQLADGSVLIDLTNDTVTANTLEAGYTAHDASGNIITGTLQIEPTGTKTVLITTNGTQEVNVAEFAKVVISTNVSGAVAWPEPTATFVAGTRIVPSCFNNAKFIPKYDNELIIYVFQPESGAPTSGSTTCYALMFHRINKAYGTTNKCWTVNGPAKTKPWSGALTSGVHNSTGVADDADGYITFPTSTWYYTNPNATIKVYEIPYSSMGASAT